ncbi:MAG: hypothetical protein IT460_15365 [Planctomycetes bacterium]|nr:hypothetical protein [Planctomycetota bacterium]
MRARTLPVRLPFLALAAAAGLALFVAGRASVHAGEPPAPAPRAAGAWASLAQPEVASDLTTLVTRLGQAATSSTIQRAMAKIAAGGREGAAAAGELQTFLADAAQGSKPVRGIDIIVEKNPGGSVLKVSKAGQTLVDFQNPAPSATARLAGSYTLTLTVEGDGTTLQIACKGPPGGGKGTPPPPSANPR